MKSRIALTIAGSDPSGGAGIQADLRVFRDHKLQGLCSVTALTVQDARQFIALNPVPPPLLELQLNHIKNFSLAGLKIGILATAENVEVVTRFLLEHKQPWVVLDPVFRSSTGADLLDERGKLLLQEELLPLVDVVTPNLNEASFFVSAPVTDIDSMEKGALMIWRAMEGAVGEKAVVIKGGHLQEAPTDLFFDGREMKMITGKRIHGGPFHGTGCRFSAALLAHLIPGKTLLQATESAKGYLSETLQNSSR